MGWFEGFLTGLVCIFFISFAAGMYFVADMHLFSDCGVGRAFARRKRKYGYMNKQDYARNRRRLLNGGVGQGLSGYRSADGGLWRDNWMTGYMCSGQGGSEA